MSMVDGLKYNIKGVALAMKTPSLLLLGLLRFVVVLVITLVFLGFVLTWHDKALSLIWEAPESGWLVYLWNTVSWILTLILSAISMVVAYLISMIFFCVFIMDYMSRITERIILGREACPDPASWVGFFIYLIKQEIPRAIIPIVITIFIMVIGLLTPVGPIVIVFSSIAAGVFLAWDNTDLTPARRMLPFKSRLEFLRRNLWFHIGFGILFLIPWLNIVFLSFAPVGATMYYLDKEKTV